MSSQNQKSSGSARPNIVLIVMDDLCWGDLSCHGNPYTKTPVLDRLRDESTRLTYYCSGPLCTPARASLMTGRYHMRTRAVDTFLGRSIMDPGEITIAQVLADHGYKTGMFGKWHLGDTYPTRAMDKGFQETLVHRGGGIGQPGDHPDNFGRESYYDPVLYRQDREERVPGYCTDIFTDATIDFIERHQKEPFFAYLATNAPHSPHVIDEKWWKKFTGKGLFDRIEKLYGMVENIDWNVGRVLQKLEELHLRENTLVIFTSDHGPCQSAQDKRAPEGQRTRFNSGLRDEKGTLYNGGVVVPCFWNLKGKMLPGVDLDRVASPIDVFPTLLGLCGIDYQPKQKMDGVDLTPLLTGKIAQDQWPDRSIFMQWHRGNEPEKYKNYAVIDQHYKMIHPLKKNQPSEDELYELTKDRFEERNVASKHPEVVAEMKKRYDAWFEDVSSTRTNNYDTVPLMLGHPSEKTVLLTRQDWRVHGPDGYNDKNYGHWEVDVCETGEYRIRVRFNQNVEPDGRVYIKHGNREEEIPAVPGKKDSISIPVKLTQGRSQIEAWLSQSGQKVSPLYIWVESVKQNGNSKVVRTPVMEGKTNG